MDEQRSWSISEDGSVFDVAVKNFFEEHSIFARLGEKPVALLGCVQ